MQSVEAWRSVPLGQLPVRRTQSNDSYLAHSTSESIHTPTPHVMPGRCQYCKQTAELNRKQGSFHASYVVSHCATVSSRYI